MPSRRKPTVEEAVDHWIKKFKTAKNVSRDLEMAITLVKHLENHRQSIAATDRLLRRFELLQQEVQAKGMISITAWQQIRDKTRPEE